MKRYGFLVLLLCGLQCTQPPTFSLQGYFFISAPNEAMAQSENPKLVAAMTKVIEAIIAEKPDGILAFIHPKQGAITDAKAFTPFAQVATTLTDANSQLYRVLWNEKYWRQSAPKDEIHSYRYVFSHAGEIRIGLFYYSDTECEIRLDFKKRPSLGLMGNPIWRKYGERWYLMNFF